MPPSRIKKYRNKRRKTAKLSKGKGKEKEKGKRIWMYQKGNITYCFRVPFLKIVPSSLHGGGYNDIEIKKNLF